MESAAALPCSQQTRSWTKWATGQIFAIRLRITRMLAKSDYLLHFSREQDGVFLSSFELFRELLL